MKSPCIFTLAILFCRIYSAEPVPSLNTVEQCSASTEEIMKAISRDNFEPLQLYMRDHWYLHGQVESDIILMQKKIQDGLTKLPESSGKSIEDSFEKIGTTTIGKSILKLVYIQKRESAPLPWVFRFYKPGEIWLLYGISFGQPAFADLNEFSEQK
jgi:hypothetical protein